MSKEHKITVRDKIWLFTSRAHDDDVFLGKSYEERFSRWSRITPAEGAHMLGVNNTIMVVSDGIPVPFSKDAYGYMESFCRMKKVIWSVTGSNGFRNGNEEEFICELAEKYPNMAGAYLDDLFDKEETDEEKMCEQLQEIRRRLDKACRPMDLWATCYIKDVEKYSAKMYEAIDVIAVWNMNTDSILKLEEEFSEYEKLLPDKRKVLGLYIYDYEKGMPVSVELMKMQCEIGLKWLKEGRIEGMVFLTNCVMGVGFKCEYWLRDWIDQVGDEVLA